jgi:hypothetical protein
MNGISEITTSSPQIEDHAHAAAKPPAERRTVTQDRPAWPTHLDFYGRGKLLLSRNLSPDATWWATSPESDREAHAVTIRLHGSSSGDGWLTLIFEYEAAAPDPQDRRASTFLDEGARFELANIIAGRLLGHASPWGDHWEWCAPPAKPTRTAPFFPKSGFAVEYAFQESAGAAGRWWITASLIRAGSDLPELPVDAPSRTDLEAASCSS